MKIKDILAIVAVALTVGGCNQQDDGLRQDDRVPIKLRASVQDAAIGQTRATTTYTTQNTEFLADELVDAYIFKSDGTTPLATGTNPLGLKVTASFTDANSVLHEGDLEPVNSSEPKYYYPTDGSGVKIYAVHPSVTSTASFSVETDQTTDDKYAKSDLCYSPMGSYSAQTASQLLTFNHVLSKIVVNITNEINNNNLPTTVKLMAKKTTAMTYPTNTAPYYTLADASDPSTITMAMTTVGTTASGGVVIPPQSFAAGASFLSFTIPDIGPMIYPMPAATNFESGKRYTYNIKVTNVGITVTTDVTDWGTKTTEVVMANKIRRCRLNPLWYVAPSNVKSYNSSTKVVTLESNPASGGSYQMYKWSDAMTYFAKQATSYNEYWSGSTITDGSSNFKYHLPSLNEWYSIISALGNIIGSTPWLSEGGLAGPVGCVFGYNDETKIGVSDWSYWSPTTGTVTARYAIRYLGTEYCSVWKYENIGYTVVITSKLIDCLEKDDPTLGTKLSTYIGNTTFWSTIDEEKGDVQRTFYYSGYVNKSGSGGTGAADSQKETHGHCWSTTQVSSNADNAWYFYIYNLPYICLNNYGKKFGFSVRLFRNDD